MKGNRPVRPLLSTGQCATLACLLEASAPKVGNVHRGADFDDLSFDHFLAAAVALGPAMEDAAALGVGQAVWRAARAVMAVAGTNTSLGTILLLAPLAAVPNKCMTADAVNRVLSQLTAEDSRLVYQAIRHMMPGGLGQSPDMDVRGTPPENLLEAMGLASGWDRVAYQYVHRFDDVLHRACPTIEEKFRRGWTLPLAIVHCQLVLMAAIPDSLIERKLGPELAQEASDRAAWVLECRDARSADYQDRLADLDFWLRSDGHRRNPGTTADLVAAALFVLLREERIWTASSGGP